MNRKLAVIGITSPLILGVCAFAILCMSIMSWLAFGSGDGDTITKIATVGPFFRAAILPSQEQDVVAISEGAEQTILAEAQADIQTTQNEFSPIPQAEAVSMTHEEVVEELGFSIPENSVNSITQVGLADRLIIPKMNLDAPISLAPIENQTWKVDHLEHSIGHLEGTAPPGADSNFVLAAHVTLGGGVYGPFAGLGKLEDGDIITVYENGEKFDYMIDDRQIVDRSAVEVTYPTDRAQITLITCNGWDPEAELYSERLVIQGHLITN